MTSTEFRDYNLSACKETIELLVEFLQTSAAPGISADIHDYY